MKWFLLRWLFPALLLVASGAGCGGDGGAPRPVSAGDATPRTSAPDETTLEVTTARTRRGTVQPLITVPGSVAPRRESLIGPEVMGRIRTIHVTVGDRVEAGQPLFELDDSIHRATLAQAEAGLVLARAQREQAESDLSRARELLAREFAPQTQVDRLATALAVARAQEKQAREQVEMARVQLGRTIVKAPYAGVIAQRGADEGTMALAQPQTVVLVLQEIDVLEARSAVAEAHLALIHVGDRARVFVQGEVAPVETQISVVAESIEPATRTYQVRMLVPNPDRRLKAGVFARVEIDGSPRENALLVPREAVRAEDGETRVYVVENERAVALPVRTGITSGGVTEVLSGLADGAEVIVGESADHVAAGMRVRIARAAREGAA